MHEETKQIVLHFIDKYLNKSDKLNIIEIGSCDVNGSIKDLFTANPEWSYTGLDISSGPNVDIISSELYHYPLKDNGFDVVVTTNTAEHVEDLVAWIKEMKRIVVPGGYIFISNPTVVNQHRYPIDCWRIYPDGFQFLGDKIDLFVCETAVLDKNHKDAFVVYKKRGANIGGFNLNRNDLTEVKQ